MNTLEKKVHEKLKTLAPNVSPGLLLQVYHHGKKVIDLDWGTTWQYYDLASLTKIFFTVPTVMRAVHLKQLNLQDPVSAYLRWYPYKASVKDLLTHSAGNQWWQPFYKSLPLDESVEMRKIILKEKLREEAPSAKTQKAVYSDIDFLLLGFLLESVREKTWTEMWQELSAALFKKESLFFCTEKAKGKALEKFAPTEECSWRGRLIQGEVHDENAWALGGVGPHAGLFGSIDAVGEWAQWFRAEYFGKRSQWTSADLTQMFTRRALKPEQGDWSLGFMMPTKGAASCGSFFSEDSFGHTGFTGTSFWMDPHRDLMVILISNRIHPTRKNELFKKARPQIHDWVCEALEV